MPKTNAGIATPLDRPWPETFATDELTLQWEFLTFLRKTAVNKLAGLTHEQAAAAPLETSPLTTLTGIVKHLTAVERFWISIIAGGLDVPGPWDGADDPDIDLRVTDADTPAAIVAAYRAEWELSRQAIAGMSLDDPTRGRDGRKDRTIRWILAHVIQETARHAGHMDILRELADGERGE